MGNKVNRKCICQECDWRGLESEILTAPNPFNPESTINGCPKCKDVDSIVYACEHPECWREVACGTPTPNGYLCTCGTHYPKEEKDDETVVPT